MTELLPQEHIREPTDLWYEVHHKKSIDVEIAQIERNKSDIYQHCLQYFKEIKPSPRSIEIASEIIRRKPNRVVEEFLSLNKAITLNFNDIKFEYEGNRFEQIKLRLLKTKEYLNEFIAVHNGEIVDHDENNVDLAKRVYEKYGYIPIYMGKVEREESIKDIPSPE